MFAAPLFDVFADMYVLGLLLSVGTLIAWFHPPAHASRASLPIAIVRAC